MSSDQEVREDGLVQDSKRRARERREMEAKVCAYLE